CCECCDWAATIDTSMPMTVSDRRPNIARRTTTRRVALWSMIVLLTADRATSSARTTDSQSLGHESRRRLRTSSPRTCPLLLPHATEARASRIAKTNFGASWRSEGDRAKTRTIGSSGLFFDFLRDMASNRSVTALLTDWSRGDTTALDQLLPLVYAE